VVNLNLDKELQRVSLRVCIIADTCERAEYYYRQFINDNHEDILIPGKHRLVMKDGTIIEKYGISQGLRDLIGKRWDQVLICYDDMPKSDFFKELLATLLTSQVPKHCWFLYYDDEWE
jgi:hypothetical protein